MEKLDSMLVHLAVPVDSSSTYPSRPILTFFIFVTQYCRDLQTASAALSYLPHRDKLERYFDTKYSVFRLDGEKDEENSLIEIFTHENHIVDLMNKSLMRQHWRRSVIHVAFLSLSLEIVNCL